MTDERFLHGFRAFDPAVAPDAAFAERLFAELADDLGFAAGEGATPAVPAPVVTPTYPAEALKRLNELETLGVPNNCRQMMRYESGAIVSVNTTDDPPMTSGYNCRLAAVCPSLYNSTHSRVVSEPGSLASTSLTTTAPRGRLGHSVSETTTALNHTSRLTMLLPAPASRRCCVEMMLSGQNDASV